ncbi:MAG: geranylgeranyl reductase family protein [Candidatus Thorarchaeota archaeon]
MEWALIREYDVIVIGGGPAGSSTAINCANQGLSVLLLEQHPKGRHKPCGGILPWVTSDIVEDIIGEEIPDYVQSRPGELGLYYVPPSGRKNSGRVRGYKIHNIDRNKYDSWLLDVAHNAGVDVHYETEFKDITTTSELLAATKNGSISFRYRYLVGADGVRSHVRKLILPHLETPFLIVGQEYWQNEKDHDLEDCFYGFFRDDISDAYAYVIPKNDEIIIGLGVQQRSSPNVSKGLGLFRDWLAKDFSFSPTKLNSKEAWSIPFGYYTTGVDNVLLVGDAAGFCNPLSGEGIRLGIESGEAACTAILAGDKGEDVHQVYHKDMSGLADMIGSLHTMVTTWDNDERDKFVEEELSRGTGSRM